MYEKRKAICYVLSLSVVVASSAVISILCTALYYSILQSYTTCRSQSTVTAKEIPSSKQTNAQRSRMC